MNIALRWTGVVVAATTLMLAGCASVSPVRTPSPSHSARALPTPTPTPAPTRPALAQLVVSPNGIGPLIIGQPVPHEADPTSVVSWDATGCGRTDLAPGSAGSGLWNANYPTDSTGELDNILVAFTVTTSGLQYDDIDSLIVWSANLKTSTGVKVGDSLAQVKAAYPSLKKDASISANSSTDLYIVSGDRGHLLLEVAKDDPNNWTPSQYGKLLWIRVEPTGTPVSSIANTDGYGPCPG